MSKADNTRRYRERHEVERSLKKYVGVEGVNYVTCRVCGKRGLYIDARHLKTRHNLTKGEYCQLFPDALLNSEKKAKAQARPDNLSNTGRKFSKETRRRMSLARTGGVPWTERDLEKYSEYRAIVRYFTTQNFNKYYWSINPNNLKRGDEYHLDHIIPVIQGFREGIDPEVIASIGNLQMLTSLDNLQKGDK